MLFFQNREATCIHRSYREMYQYFVKLISDRTLSGEPMPISRKIAAEFQGWGGPDPPTPGTWFAQDSPRFAKYGVQTEL